MDLYSIEGAGYKLGITEYRVRKYLEAMIEKGLAFRLKSKPTIKNRVIAISSEGLEYIEKMEG